MSTKPREQPDVSPCTTVSELGRLPQLGDCRAHAQRAHRHRQLVEGVDVSGAGVEVEALAKFCVQRPAKRLFLGCVIHLWSWGSHAT